MSGPEQPRRPAPPDRGLAGRWVPDPLAAKRGMASAYQGAIEAVVAMVICALAGWWIDRRLGSEPWGLFVGMAFGFAALLLRLLRIKTPTIGRAEPVPRDDEGDRDRDWSSVLTPDRDPDHEQDRDGDEESGGAPESK